MDYEAFHDHYVSQGVAVLDTHVPDWRSKIKARTFNIEEAWDCALGQVFGDAWREAHADYQEARREWLASDQSAEPPAFPESTPFHYGRDILIVAAGGTLAPQNHTARSQWCADHGFLSDMKVSAAGFSDDPEVTEQPLFPRDLNDAWARALASAS